MIVILDFTMKMVIYLIQTAFLEKDNLGVYFQASSIDDNYYLSKY